MEAAREEMRREWLAQQKPAQESVRKGTSNVMKPRPPRYRQELLDPFDRAWRESLSPAAQDALERHECLFKTQVQRRGRKAFARDPKISKAVLLEIEATIGVWEPSASLPPSDGPAWNRTNPPKRGKPSR